MGVMGYLKDEIYLFEKKFRAVPKSFGQCYIEGGVCPVPAKDKLYHFYLQAELHVGDFDWFSFADMIKVILREAEREDISGLEIQKAVALFSEVDEERALKLLARFFKNFPNFLGRTLISA